MPKPIKKNWSAGSVEFMDETGGLTTVRDWAIYHLAATYGASMSWKLQIKAVNSLINALDMHCEKRVLAAVAEQRS